MDLILDEQQGMIRDTAVRLARTLADMPSGQREAEWWALSAAVGLPRLLVPEDLGGLGLGARELVLVAEAVGKSGLLLPLSEALVCARSLAQAGERHELAHMLAGDRLLLPALDASWWSYRGPIDGAAPQVVQGFPTARNVDAFLAASSRGHVSADLRLVQGEEVSHVVLVDGSSAGYLTMPGAAAIPVAERQPAAAILDEARSLLEIAACAELLGVAQTSLSMTLSHLGLREQFGRPLAANQALQHRMADLFVALELDAALAWRIASDFDAGTLRPPMLAASKARASRTTLRVVREMLQMHGALGYTESHPAGRFYKRATALAARYGDDILQTTRFSNLTLADAR